MNLCKKYIIWRCTHKLGGKIKRNVRRSFRLEKIKINKKAIILDIRTGHNVGDFRLEPQEIHDVLIFDRRTPIEKIKMLHFKYRG